MAVFLAVLALVTGVLYVKKYINDKKVDTTVQEKKMTHAEELESKKLIDGASQEEHDIINLRNAWAYADEENYNKALELLESIDDPVSSGLESPCYELYTEVLDKLGRKEESQKYARKVLELNEKDMLAQAEEYPTTYYDLGRMYASAGQTEKAKEAFQKVIKAYSGAAGEEIDENGNQYKEIARLAEQAMKDLQ